MLAVLIAMALGACAEPRGAEVSISDVRILAPAIAGQASVAYFTVHNRSNETLTLSRVDSPQFGSVEMHETTFDNGVARMRRIESIDVASQSTLSFASGGMHVMLMQPAASTTPGAPITLEILVGDNLLLVRAELQDRLARQ